MFALKAGGIKTCWNQNSDARRRHCGRTFPVAGRHMWRHYPFNQS